MLHCLYQGCGKFLSSGIKSVSLTCQYIKCLPRFSLLVATPDQNLIRHTIEGAIFWKTVTINIES